MSVACGESFAPTATRRPFRSATVRTESLSRFSHCHRRNPSSSLNASSELYTIGQ
jgi:hypothetical protein